MLGSMFFQYYAAICANIASLVYGLSVGWISPTLPHLFATDTSLPSGPITTDEASWISSLLYIGGSVGTIIFGWLADRIGRKWSLYAGTVPHIVAFLLITFAQNVIYLYISRFLSGIAGGALFCVLPIYVSEISENSIRGILGFFVGNLVNIGILLGYVIGHYMHFNEYPYVVLGVLAIFVVAFALLPETPQYLLMKNKVDDAENSLKFFRGLKGNAEVTVAFKEEFSRLQNFCNKSSDAKSLSLDDFKPRSTRIGLLISFALLCGRNFCGLFPLITFTAMVFEEAESSLSPNLSAIIAALIMVLGGIASTFLIDRAGRKILLFASSLGTGICLTVLGVHFFLKDHGIDMSAHGWLPLVSFSGAIFIGSWGLLVIPFFVMAEILPTKVRSITATVFMVIQWPITFLLVKYFIIVGLKYGMHTCMWFFAICCFLQAVFIVFMQPETKGKSTDEIIEILSNKKK
ncbi:TRET1 [Sergentomyia squamirostris]